MKSLSVHKVLAAFLMLALMGAGCQRKPDPGITHIPGRSPVAPGGDTLTGPVTGPRTDRPGPLLPPPVDTQVTAIPPNEDGTFPLAAREEEGNFWVDRDIFQEQTVYFEFDRSAIDPNERQKIEHVANYLRSNPSYQVRVEGHCDERGTVEYNRALGERRAMAVREVLINMGIAPERVSTISFGEDQPAVLGHDEWAYAQNRRGEFVLLRPKDR